MGSFTAITASFPFFSFAAANARRKRWASFALPGSGTWKMAMDWQQFV
jgi:hypothetical protein